MSRELNTWMMLFGVAIILAMMAPGVMNDLKVLLRNHIEMSYQLSLGPSEIGSYLVGMLVALLKILAGPFLLLVIFALFSGMSQNGILFATETTETQAQQDFTDCRRQEMVLGQELCGVLKGDFENHHRRHHGGDYAGP